MVPKATVSAIDECIMLAHTLGCKRKQVGGFLKAGYVPQRRQLEFHALARLADYEGGPERIGYGGTRG